ncbi:hypothetical protein E1A91_D01G193700v1 [Gossypium mustelinum]|uniref:Uncharacterized protein n=1 Tax=Gossypium mustelinum TaxID=34275 RepID=A0A5D2WBD9_GOSMU|nr:hypothetical protein E1A91_D01G193700v1 [Gossypium mustelinum]
MARLKYGRVRPFPPPFFSPIPKSTSISTDRPFHLRSSTAPPISRISSYKYSSSGYSFNRKKSNRQHSSLIKKGTFANV